MDGSIDGCLYVYMYVGFVGNAYWDGFFSENVSDPVVESYRDVRDLKDKHELIAKFKICFSNFTWKSRFRQIQGSFQKHELGSR